MELERQRAYIVCGNAGVGKSTFAARLCREKSAALIDIDTVTERLAKLVLRGHGLPEDDRDSPEYKALLREPIYEALFDVALDNLPHLPCVIVGPFTRERREASWPARLAVRLSTTVDIYVVWCSSQERQRRIELRGNPRDAGKLVDFDTYAAQGEDVSPPPFHHHWVDTTHG
ncbi:MAG TPA: AAA family ATPase [Polyangiaceae bacterium]|nr:AAA family ATPase [Polyangiaceae bacterium]